MAQPGERLSVSVVVVSHGRPESLLWCLAALAGQRYAPFELVVVADEAGFSAVTGSVFAQKLKLIRFDEANISAARNRGIAQAAGDIIAFIDDDAAAEPMWLHELTRPFSELQADCVGGYVRGRNGISFQWTARQVDSAGRPEPLEAPESGDAFLPTPGEGRATKTEGTNMAVRADVLRELGGFDEAFRFFLDETDLNLRLAAGGYRTALAPSAEVHHAYAASARRGKDRAVKDLHEVGASSAVLQAKFGNPPERLDEIRAEQTARLKAQTEAGLLARKQAEEVLQSLEDGFAEGAARQPASHPESLQPREGFRAFAGASGPVSLLSGRWFQRRRLRREAQRRAARGESVSLFLFAPTTRFHRVRFDCGGYWEQAGGLFGRAERNERLFKLCLFRQRIEREKARVARQRGF